MPLVHVLYESGDVRYAYFSTTCIVLLICVIKKDASRNRRGAAKYEELQGFKRDWQSMDGSLVQAPTRQSTSLSEEGVGKNPTHRGKSGSKIHLWVDQEVMPCGVALAGANVHDSRLVAAPLDACILSAPKTEPVTERPHLCLDKAYDMKRVEIEVLNHNFTPHIRRIGEEKQPGPLGRHPARRWVVERTFAWLKGAGLSELATPAGAPTIWHCFIWLAP